jgi:hypothetical protein
MRHSAVDRGGGVGSDLNEKITISCIGRSGALAALQLLDRSPGYACVAAPCQRPALLDGSDGESPTQDTRILAQ